MVLALSKFQYFLSVTVFFDPTGYTVTEGVDTVATLMVARSGGLARTVVVSITLTDGTAIGMTHHCLQQHCIQHTMIDLVWFNPSYMYMFCSHLCVTTKNMT